MQDLIDECKKIIERYREDISKLIPKFKLRIQEECDRLVRDVSETSVLKAVEAVELYIYNDELTFDLLSNPDKTRNYAEAGELSVTALINVHDDRIVELFRIKVDEDNIPGRFINMINLLRSSELLIPFMFEDDKSITFWINKSNPNFLESTSSTIGLSEN